jgi:hypothetical protein
LVFPDSDGMAGCRIQQKGKDHAECSERDLNP